MRIRGIGRLRRIARRVTKMFVPRAIILLYHRVTELALDPQLLCVSRHHFAEHLEILQKTGRTVQLETLDQTIRFGKPGRCAVVVTFDDGYVDNLSNAKPLMERYDVPATVFVTAGYVGSTREFWHDELERIFLHGGTLPKTLSLKINGHCYEWELGSTVNCREYTFRDFREWNVSRKDDPTVCHHLYRSLCQMLQPLRDEERQEVMENLAVWAGMDKIRRPTHRTLSTEEVIQLADGGLIQIGSHTVSHPVLSALPLRAQMDEISESKARLEEILGHAVTSFAYPYGGRSHYTEETVAAVRDAGFMRACSNFAGIVRPGTDPWQLPRFLVRDWDGDQFARNLKGWIDA